MDASPSAPARVFCLSMPRNGIASLGRFCRDFGLPTALAPAHREHRWTEAWLGGDFEAIFASKQFTDARVVAGAPWCLPEFYKVAFQRYPTARFVLLTREPAAWFASMLAQAGGLASGDSRVHAKAFRRHVLLTVLLKRHGVRGFDVLLLPDGFFGQGGEVRQLAGRQRLGLQDALRFFRLRTGEFDEGVVVAAGHGSEHAG